MVKSFWLGIPDFDNLYQVEINTDAIQYTNNNNKIGSQTQQGRKNNPDPDVQTNNAISL